MSKPFTGRDVKATFDMLRETPDAPAKLRLNPRKEWYANAGVACRKCGATS